MRASDSSYSYSQSHECELTKINEKVTKLARAIAILWKINMRKITVKEVKVPNPNPVPIKYKK